jgi:hypothetical protein
VFDFVFHVNGVRRQDQADPGKEASAQDGGHDDDDDDDEGGDNEEGGKLLNVGNRTGNRSKRNAFRMGKKDDDGRSR